MLKRLFKITVSLVLIAGILKIIGIEKLVLNFRAVNIYLILLALSLSPFVVFLGTEKWRQIIRHEANEVSYKDALISFLGGMSLGLLTPGRVGELGRIAFIIAGRKAVLIGVALIDRIIDLEVTLFFGVFGAYVYFGIPGILLIMCIIVTGGTIIFWPQTYYMLFENIIKLFPYQEKIQSILMGATTIPRKSLVSCIMLRFLVSFIDALQFYILINSFVQVGFLPVLVVYPVIILINILPVTIMGIGLRESAAMLTLSRFGVPPEASVSASFILFCLNTLLPGVVGALFVPRIKLTTKSVKIWAA